LAADERDPLFSGDSHGQVMRTILNSMNNMEPLTAEVQDTLLVSYPLVIGSSLLSGSGTFNVPWTVITAVPLSTVLEPLKGLLRFSIIFIIASGGLTAAVVSLTTKGLSQRSLALQRTLQQVSTMQDNLKYGLLLFDQGLVIQGAYSKAVEYILGVSEIQGKQFTELLAGSLKSSEMEGLKDYFRMIFKRAFDEKMLEGINPIHEFTYINPETGAQKSLRSSFALIDRKEWIELYLLCTLEDITAEKELQKQLKEAISVRDEEMRYLFQVLQLNPRVLGDFIEDTEYEFGRINKTLRNRKLQPGEILGEIYQSVHAVKSNAVILNLDNFAASLHSLETSIKTLREKPDVAFDDILGIILELEDMMKEKDRLQNAILKIKNFQEESFIGSSQELFVLMETLSQVCIKAQTALDKQARLDMENIDDEVLIHGPRRILKEVLTQLIRNSVYHGIETPQEREKAGKDAMGEIQVAIWHEKNSLFIRLSDDGRGIDYAKVNKRADQLKLFRSLADVNNKDFLLKALFAPGFSTAEASGLHAGRGVGLSLVRDRVRELNGSIKVRSEAGKGTSFLITIPMELPVGKEISA
jgi:two-component system chemotaxis sensor kinase CheA